MPTAGATGSAYCCVAGTVCRRCGAHAIRQHREELRATFGGLGVPCATFVQAKARCR